ncbi:hypothetical protein PoB_000120500 [Plakobranchus ocellatus]|uniref:Uncharacterized protein n=1 Tax=Plakobranchus ocellatus TaxID=259542 RepID=A0AAV3XVS4_9GAST|nr:hypothetical protein PoB_000120500 [Plakobranchus ocellatus]
MGEKGRQGEGGFFRVEFGFLCIASPQGDLRRPDPPSDQGAIGGVRTLDKKSLQISRRVRYPVLRSEPCLFYASDYTYLRPHQGDLRLLGPTSGQGAGGGARTRDRRVPADLRADSLTTVFKKERSTRSVEKGNVGANRSEICKDQPVAVEAPPPGGGPESLR